MSGKWFCLTAAMAVVAVIFVLVCSTVAGQGVKGSDRVLSKITFIHFRKPPAKPPWAGGGNGGGKKKDEGVYSFIAKGAKWKAEQDVLVNPICDENLDGSLDDLITNAVINGMWEWETADSADDGTHDADRRIFGGVDIDYTVSYNGGIERGYNTISFGYYGNTNVIGVTTVWGYFSGHPSLREIIETHMQLNDAFEWGDTVGDPSLMDVRNIITHELGHCVGMSDVYQPGAIEETMYGYSTEGEIKKRDLYRGDISGATELYK